MALRELVSEKSSEPVAALKPYYVVSIHFHELDGQLHDRIRARFTDRIWHRLTSHSFLPRYIQLGVKTLSLTEAIEIAKEYMDGFTVMTEIAVEGWGSA